MTNTLPMPNQRAIAEALGLNQTTVSLALRGHPRIPEATRERVRQEAERLGYRSNAYVSALMQHIRSGRPLQDKGCIAIIIDAESEKDWLVHEVYRRQYQSMTARAERLGFHAECFYLRQTGMSEQTVNRILSARGIEGMILAAPRRLRDETPCFDWSRFACVANGFSWQQAKVDVVANHHLRNVEIVWDELHRRGYRRIGMCLPQAAASGGNSYWLHAYLGRQHLHPSAAAIPLMAGNPDEAPYARFKKWYEKWRPEAIICPAGHEMIWFRRMGLRIPQDLAVACLASVPGEPYSGVVEDSDLLGATLVELVAGKIFCNEFGLPAHPKVTLIAGRWIDGDTVPPVNPGRQESPTRSRRFSPQGG